MSHKKEYIGRFEHLKNRPRSDEASEMILKIASLVKPIMKSHSWTVGTLGEFFPAQPNLLGLNINGGEKILIRLRPFNDPNNFYPMEDLVGTMLHELTHNVHGPHDAAFYKLLDTLKSEFSDLQRSGYTGDGFHSDGSRLGGSHGVPQHIGKIKALEAAEARRKKMTVMGRGGRLGGTPGGVGGRGRSLREILADVSLRILQNERYGMKLNGEDVVQAAERRIKDDKSCVHDHGTMAEEESKKASAESTGINASDVPDELQEEVDRDVPGPSGIRGLARDPIDVDADEEPVAPEPNGTSASKPKIKSTPPAPAKPIATSFNNPVARKPRLSPALSSAPHPHLHADGTWSCPACTLLNTPSRLSCEACGGPKPKDETKGWWCDVCGEFGNEHGRWMCLACGRIRREG